MQILQAAVNDAENILEVQKQAFKTEAELYGTLNIAPLTQTIEELRGQFKNYAILKAVVDGNIVGTVRAFQKDSTCFVERLAVLPEFRNKGIGTGLMREIENYFKPGRFELFTGAKSVNNINLYKNLGYTVFKSGQGCGADVEMVYMEKTVK